LLGIAIQARLPPLIERPVLTITKRLGTLGVDRGAIERLWFSAKHSRAAGVSLKAKKPKAGAVSNPALDPDPTPCSYLPQFQAIRAFLLRCRRRQGVGPVSSALGMTGRRKSEGINTMGRRILMPWRTNPNVTTL